MHRFLSRVQVSASNKPTLSRTRPPSPYRPTPRTQNTLIRRNNPQVLNSPIRRYAYRPARNRYAGRSLSRADDHSRVFSGLVSVSRCIGVLPQSCADHSRSPRRVGVSVYRRIAAILRRSLPGFAWSGVSVYRCIATILRRSFPVLCHPAPLTPGVPSGRCIGILFVSRGFLGSVCRCIGIFRFFDPLRGHTEPFGAPQLLDSTLEDRLTFWGLGCRAFGLRALFEGV